MDTVLPDYQAAIDEALQLVYSQHHRLISRLHKDSFQELTLEQLREGALGQDLRRLAAVARGDETEPKEQVLLAIDSVLQVLFWPAAADDYMVPRSFWDTDLGRMLALAKYRAYDRAELVSIGSAAQQLGVTRPTIYRWMDDRTLNYVRDDMSGRTFVVRRDVDMLRQVASRTDDGEPVGRRGATPPMEAFPRTSRQPSLRHVHRRAGSWREARPGSRRYWCPTSLPGRLPPGRHLLAVP